MKNDRYLKAILTVIAICLLWIIIRDIPLTPKLFANPPENNSEVDVRITGSSRTAFYLAEPIQVEVSNASAIAEQVAALLDSK